MSQTLRVVDGDLFISPVSGRAEILDGPDKASQDIAEVLMTPLAQPTAEAPDPPPSPDLMIDLLNALDLPARDYGSELAFIDVPPQLSSALSKALIEKKVDEAIQRLRRLQQDDPLSTPDERIAGISKLVVVRVDTHSFAFFLEVALESSNFNPQRVILVSNRHQVSDGTFSVLKNQIQSQI